jgi:hypothetical protein
MDKTQLTTIIATALVSVVAKEVITWLVAILKTLQVSGDVQAKFKKVFSKRNCSILYDVLALAFYIGILVNFGLSTSAASRLDILIAIGAVIAAFFCVFSLLLNIYKWQQERVATK